MPPAGSLTDEQLRFFDANGYLVLGSFSSAEEVRAMRDRMAELVDGFDGAGDVFSTKDHRQVKNDFFFKSAENISFFFEEKAFGDDGCLKQAKELSINKVGHALHELDPVFKKFSFGANVSSLFSSLRYKRPAVIQSMYIFKALVARWYHTRIIHSYIQTLHRAQGCGLHSKMRQKRMVAFGQFLDHIKMA
ncbi:Os03g0708100 [Oryza sativa Japonica Group]|uniref:Os03g0708100 protein n=1 Tax=Oryza sativa subsp. japonica TaxID=39947 RepID=A0A0P0W1Z2_ORYSJ|nr:hypothetical protein EE612_019949 [Oryza sativa]BAS85991.1 Os03g0708100 [Oryza sativa Japonica Group]